MYYLDGDETDIALGSGQTLRLYEQDEEIKEVSEPFYDFKANFLRELAILFLMVFPDDYSLFFLHLTICLLTTLLLIILTLIFLLFLDYQPRKSRKIVE